MSQHSQAGSQIDISKLTNIITHLNTFYPIVSLRFLNINTYKNYYDT